MAAAVLFCMIVKWNCFTQSDFLQDYPKSTENLDIIG